MLFHTQQAGRNLSGTKPSAARMRVEQGAQQPQSVGVSSHSPHGRQQGHCLKRRKASSHPGTSPHLSEHTQETLAHKPKEMWCIYIYIQKAHCDISGNYQN